MTAQEFLDQGAVAKSTAYCHADGRCTVTVEALTYADMQRSLRKLADDIDEWDEHDFSVRTRFLEASRED